MDNVGIRKIENRPRNSNNRICNKPSVKKDDDQYEKVLAKTEPTSYQEINKTNDADVGGDQQDDDGMCIILPTYVNTY